MAEKYDLILQDAVYVNPKHDITDKVIKALNAAPPSKLGCKAGARVTLRLASIVEALGGELHGRCRRC